MRHASEWTIPSLTGVIGLHSAFCPWWRLSEGPDTTSVWIWRKIVQQFPRHIWFTKKKLELKMFYQTYTARRSPKSPLAATERSVRCCLTFAASTLQCVMQENRPFRCCWGWWECTARFVPGDPDIHSHLSEGPDTSCVNLSQIRSAAPEISTETPVFSPWWPWPLTLTFKLIWARDQTRLPYKFGTNPFSSSPDISYTNKKVDKHFS